MGRDSLQSWLRSVTEAKIYQTVFLQSQQKNAAKFFKIPRSPVRTAEEPHHRQTTAFFTADDGTADDSSLTGSSCHGDGSTVASYSFEESFIHDPGLVCPSLQILLKWWGGTAVLPYNCRLLPAGCKQYKYSFAPLYFYVGKNCIGGGEDCFSLIRAVVAWYIKHISVFQCPW